MSLTNKLYKSRSVILDMLEIRGYQGEKYQNYTINEIDIMNRNTPAKAVSDISPLDMKAPFGIHKPWANKGGAWDNIKRVCEGVEILADLQWIED